MGEITEALRLARREMERRAELAPQRHRRAARETAALRHHQPPEAGPEDPDTAPARRRAPLRLVAPDASPEPEASLVPSGGRHRRIRIPRTRAGLWTARAVAVDRAGPAAECFRHLAVRVLRALEQQSRRSLLVTSALSGEGKTLTACNLALALASVSAGRRIALVDLDLRRPSVATAMGLSPEQGFDHVLRGMASLEDVCFPTNFEALDLFPAAAARRHAHELLVGERLTHAIAELSHAYRVVIIDGPGVLPVPDVPLVAEHVDACLSVVRSGVSRDASLRAMLDLLPREKLIGHFLNDVRMPRYARQYDRT